MTTRLVMLAVGVMTAVAAIPAQAVPVATVLAADTNGHPIPGTLTIRTLITAASYAYELEQ